MVKFKKISGRLPRLFPIAESRIKGGSDLLAGFGLQDGTIDGFEHRNIIGRFQLIQPAFLYSA